MVYLLSVHFEDKRFPRQLRREFEMLFLPYSLLFFPIDFASNREKVTRSRELRGFFFYVYFSLKKWCSIESEEIHVCLFDFNEFTFLNGR